ncbi:hypothetical protein EMCRGX_G003018 [Ephydatia muelleri]
MPRVVCIFIAVLGVPLVSAQVTCYTSNDTCSSTDFTTSDSSQGTGQCCVKEGGRSYKWGHRSLLGLRSVRVFSRPGLHLFTYHKHLSQRRVVYFGYVNEVTISLSSQCRIWYFEQQNDQSAVFTEPSFGQQSLTASTTQSVLQSMEPMKQPCCSAGSTSCAWVGLISWRYAYRI